MNEQTTAQIADQTTATPANATTTETTHAAAPLGGDGAKGGGEQPDMVLGGGAGPLEGLSEEYRNHKALRGFKSHDEIAKSLIETQKMVGENRLKLPGEDATAEELDSFYAALGRPENADDYQLDVPDNLPVGVEFSDQDLQAFKGVFHELGLSQDQAQLAFARRNEMALAGLEQQTAERAETYRQGQGELDAKWREEGRDPKAVTEQINRIIDEFGGPPIKDWLRTTGEGNNPAMREFLGGIAASMGEHGYVSGNAAASAATREGAQKEIDALSSDAGFQADFGGKNGPAARKAAYGRWQTLNDIAAA